MNIRTIAIIPARGGSKRLSKKNIMLFQGKPMIYWTIKAAIESKLFDYIMVSTDSGEIADISIKCGAKVPFLRNASDADDHTPVSVATTNALIQLEDALNTHFDIGIQLMPNCPLRTSVDIVNAYTAFNESGSDFQISVFKYGWMNPWWAMRIDMNKMKPIRLFPEAYIKRSQDLEELYCPTGAVWIAKAKKLKEQKTFYGEEYTVCTMDWQHAIDIDDIDDFRMAEVLAMLQTK